MGICHVNNARDQLYYIKSRGVTGHDISTRSARVILGTRVTDPSCVTITNQASRPSCWSACFLDSFILSPVLSLPLFSTTKQWDVSSLMWKVSFLWPFVILLRSRECPTQLWSEKAAIDFHRFSIDFPFPGSWQPLFWAWPGPGSPDFLFIDFWCDMRLIVSEFSRLMFPQITINENSFHEFCL